MIELDFSKADPEPETEATNDDEPPHRPAPEPQPGLAFTSVFGVVLGLVLLTLFAGPSLDYTRKTAAQLFAPEQYISAVLGRED